MGLNSVKDSNQVFGLPLHAKVTISNLTEERRSRVRRYALCLEEWLVCFRVLKYDIESEGLTKSLPAASKVHSRTRMLACDELLEQLPALQ